VQAHGGHANQLEQARTVHVLDTLTKLAHRIRSAFHGGPTGFPEEWQLLGPAFHDRRDTAAQVHHGARVRSRPWRSVTGICLHQTACLLGERPTRWDSVGAHIGITRGGKVILLHGFDRIVAHGNGWNAQTVGIEIDGLYAGVEGDASTVWDDPSTPSRERGMVLTDETVTAAHAVIRWIVSDVASHGGAVRALVAHRQSSDSRRNDPGSAVWQRIALPMSAELGLTDGGDGFAIGGRPIPVEWDPRRTRRY
jgi:hypothetical protein